MHIVFVTNELASENNPTGGLGTFTSNMAQIFHENGHKVTIILATVKEDKTIFIPGIELIKVNIPLNIWKIFYMLSKCIHPGSKMKSDQTRYVFNGSYLSFQVRKRLKQMHGKGHIDIIHYCNLGNMFIHASKKIPYVVRMSSFYLVSEKYNYKEYYDKLPNEKCLYKEHIQNRKLKRTKYIISPSVNIAREMEKLLGVNPTVIDSPFLLNAVQWNKEVYQNELKNKKYILFFGHMRYRKGLTAIFDTVYPVLEKYQDIYVAVAGNNLKIVNEFTGEIVNPLEQIYTAAKEHRNRVIYLGNLSHSQLYPVIKNAELCFLPYRFDNLSNACIECMAIGSIVVGTYGSSFEQLIDDRVSGFLCERDNSESFLKGIEEALNMSEEEKNKMITKAKERIKLLSPDRVYERYLAFYEKAIREW